MQPHASPVVLLSHHGTITSLEDLPQFLNNIRRGRPTPPELLAEMRHRYEAIGGSPLIAESRSIATRLADRLGVSVLTAGRLFGPYPADVLPRSGPLDVISLPLAPQSVDVYHAVVALACDAIGATCSKVPSYGDSALLIATLAAEVRAVVGEHRDAGVILSAHSLPLRVIRGGDPYERDFRAMAEAVRAELADLPVEICFQSQGASAEPWLGPTLEDAMSALRSKGARTLVVSPIGFVSEHIETLYDLDIEARAQALGLGFDRFLRVQAVGRTDAFIEVLAEAARPYLPTSG